MNARSETNTSRDPFSGTDMTLPQAMAESSPAAILILDAQGRPVLMNMRMRNLLGLPEDDCPLPTVGEVRRLIDDMILEPADFSDSIDAVLEAPNLSMVETVSLRDGRYLEISCSPLRIDDRTVGRIWFAREVTDVLRDAEAKSFDAAVMEDTAAEMVHLAEEYYHLKAESDAARASLERQQKLLEKLANTDSLTGIANRRAFMEAAETAFDECQRSGKPLSVAVIDFDLFKDVNDEYGHNAGDRVLRETVEAMQGCLKDGALLARLGGEEFALLCIGCDGDESLAISETLRQAVATRAVMVKSVPLQTSVSIGVATLDAKENDVENLLKRADKALYAAKADGRNCVRQAPCPSKNRQHTAILAV
mgnify:CR=1 FL=1